MCNLISDSLHLEAALTWYDQGFCVMPARFDGSKRPRFEWKEFQGIRPYRHVTERWYLQEPQLGVGLICGNVSGGLEMLELEGRATSGDHFDKIRAECDAVNITWLWDLLTLDGYAEWTPSGGIHLLYRVSDHDIPGNTKIAMSVDKLTLAETRGEGGFVIVAPTSGTVHQTGQAWTLAAGEYGKVPVIAWDDRELLHAAIRKAIDERPVHVAPVVERRPLRERSPGEISPMDDFNARGDWHDILTPRGWTHHSRTSTQEFWTRPGKDPRDGHSAATGHQGSPNLYVWSGMDDERHYTKAQFIAYSDFAGDFAATTKQLAREGFGTPLPVRSLEIRYPETDTKVSATIPDFDEAVAAAQAANEAKPTSEPRMAEWTHVGAGRFAAQLHRDQFHEIYEEKGWRVYGDGIWSEDRTKKVGRAMEVVSDKIQRQAESQLVRAEAAFAHEGTDENKRRVRTAEKNLTFARGCASDTGQKAIVSRYSHQEGVARSIKEFDTRRDLVCLDNGTLNLRTRELVDHDPRHLLTRRAGKVSYDPDARAPMFDKYISEAVPDEQQRRYLQRMAGYALLGVPNECAFVILQGAPGCGKSQFINILSALGGDYSATAAASTFRASNSEATNNLHDLRGARIVTTSETERGSTLDGELIKRVTGDDPVTTRALYQSNITWDPEFTLFMAVNDIPNIRSDDDGIWKRVKIVRFPRVFRDMPGQIRKISDTIIENELAGVLNWALEGLKDYLDNGMQEPSSVTEDVRSERDENDPVIQFLAESVQDAQLIIDKDQEIRSYALYSRYVAWCKNTGERSVLGSRRFSKRLDSLPGLGTRKGTGNQHMRTGIGLHPHAWIGPA